MMRFPLTIQRMGIQLQINGRSLRPFSDANIIFLAVIVLKTILESPFTMLCTNMAIYLKKVVAHLLAWRTDVVGKIRRIFRNLTFHCSYKIVDVTNGSSFQYADLGLKMAEENLEAFDFFM